MESLKVYVTAKPAKLKRVEIQEVTPETGTRSYCTIINRLRYLVGNNKHEGVDARRVISGQLHCLLIILRRFSRPAVSTTCLIELMHDQHKLNKLLFYRNPKDSRR